MESSVYTKEESGLESGAYDARNTVTGVLKPARKLRSSEAIKMKSEVSIKSRSPEVSMRSRNSEALNILLT